MRDTCEALSEKGQVTLPVEVRRALGIAPRGKVAFEIDQREVRVKAARSAVDETFSTVPAVEEKLAWDEMRRIAQEDAAAEAAIEGL